MSLIIFMTAAISSFPLLIRTVTHLDVCFGVGVASIYRIVSLFLQFQ